MTPSSPPPEPASSPAQPPRKGRRKSWRRWAWRLGGAGVLLLGVLVGAAVWVTRPANLTPLVERAINRSTGGQTDIARAVLTWGGVLRLEHPRLSLPDQPETPQAFERLFEAELITVRIDPAGLLTGNLRADELRLEAPTLYLVEDLDRDRLNLEMLELPEDEDERALPLRLPPEVDLRGAQVRFGKVEDGQFSAVDRMRLEGEMREAPQAQQRYRFELRQMASTDLERVQSTLSGIIDLKDVTLKLRLEGFGIDQPHRYLIPHQFRDLWDRLAPTGRLPTLVVEMGSSRGNQLGVERVALELENVAITPPYAELGISTTDPETGESYRPRMTNVSGRFVLDRQGVGIEDFTGAIEGVDYYATGRWPLTPEGQGRLVVRTDPFDIEKNPRFLASLPVMGLKIYERLSPRGRFQAAFEIHRDNAADDTDVNGRIDLLGASGQYHQFPYRLFDVTGRVTFNDTAVHLLDITGRGPSGGTVRINGTIAPPGDGAGVHINVVGTDLPYDDHVLNALGPERRDDVVMFFDPASQRELIAEGVIRSQRVGMSKRMNDNAPLFELGGSVDVNVQIDRPIGADADYQVVTRIDAAGINVLFRHFSYPVHVRSGQVTVAEGGIEISDLVLEGISGGGAVVSGRLDQPVKHGPVFPEIALGNIHLPIDRYLLHAIEPDHRQTVKDLHLGGRIEGAARIFRQEGATDTGLLVEGRIVDGRAQPNAGRLTLSDVTGAFRLDRSSLTLTQVTASYGASEIDLSGRFEWSGERDSIRLDIAAVDLSIDAALLDALPADFQRRPRLEALFEEHRPEGMGDAALHYAKGPAHRRSPRYEVTLEPDAVAFDWRGKRIQLNDMTGRLMVHPGRVDLDALAGDFGSGRGQVSGTISTDSQSPSAVTFVAQATTHCPVTRHIVPDPLVRILDELEVDGGYRLTDARLLYRPQPEAEQNEIEFDGHIALDNAAARIGVDIEALNATIETHVRQRPDRRWPQVTMRIDAPSLRAAQRTIEPLQVVVSNRADPSRLSFDQILGGVYGGLLIGQGSVDLGEGGFYRFDLTLNDVAVDPFLSPAEFDPNHPDAHPSVAGRTAPRPFTDLSDAADFGELSASLSIQAPLDNPELRQGRGALLIRGATLLHRPLSVALLRAVSLSLPSGAPLTACSARYLINGDRVTFDSVTFAGPGLNLSGSGSMSYPGMELDLTLVSRNSGLLQLGLITDLFNVFKDELIAIRVDGTLIEPTASLDTLAGLREGWERLFSNTRAQPVEQDYRIGER